MTPRPAPFDVRRYFFSLGQIREFRRDPLGYWSRLSRREGDLLCIGPGNYFTVDADDARHVLQQRHASFAKANGAHHWMRLLVGDGLLTSAGALWARQRRAAQPAFLGPRMEDYLPAMATAAERVATAWAAAGDQPVDVWASMMRLSFGAVVEAFFGRRDEAELAEATEDLLAVVDWIQVRSLLPWPLVTLARWGLVWPHSRGRPFDQALARLEALLDRMLASADPALPGVALVARSQAAEAGAPDPRPRQARDELATILLAGAETTGTTMAWLWYLLATHPAELAAVRDELARVLGDRPLGGGDLESLPRTRWAADEALRMFPPVYSLRFEALADETLPCGQVVEAGDMIAVGIHGIHHNPRYWTDPDRFDPSRFGPEPSAARPRHAYLPFSLGPRACIGSGFALTEILAMAASLLRRFDLEFLPGTSTEVRLGFTLRPRTGLMARVRRT